MQREQGLNFFLCQLLGYLRDSWLNASGKFVDFRKIQQENNLKKAGYDLHVKVIK